MVSTIGVRDGKGGGLAPPWLGNILGQTMFSGQAQVVQKSWTIKTIFSIQ